MRNKKVYYGTFKKVNINNGLQSSFKISNVFSVDIEIKKVVMVDSEVFLYKGISNGNTVEGRVNLTNNKASIKGLRLPKSNTIAV